MRFFILLLMCIVSNAYSQTDLTNYLPKDYVKNGSKDYTSYLQKGLDENNNLLLPNFPILINYNGLKLKSHQTLKFQDNSSLKMAANSKDSYAMLYLENVDNVTIYNATLVGDKEIHTGRTGEWGMGIKIASSSNVLIENPKISKTWGDGIYIGELTVAERRGISKKVFTCTNIVVKGGLIDDCLRNGISITSGENVLLDGIIIQNIVTKAPKAAIDIEPNNKSNIIKNINIKDIVTKNNFNGIVIMLVKLIDTKQVDVGYISVVNHKDYDSKSTLTIANYSKKLESQNNLQALKGEITIANNSYYGTGKIYTHKGDSKFNPKINFKNVNYYKKEGKNYILNNAFNNAFSKSIKNDKNIKLN